MSEILDDYRGWAAEQPQHVSSHTDRCHMWRGHEACMIHRLAAALESARLTDEGSMQHEWIPVGERLPDHGGTVVCRTAGRQLQFGRVMTTRKYDGGEFAETYCWMGYPDGHLDVTYWFPLPDPPEVK